MSKNRYRPEEIIAKLREADVLISHGKKVVDVIKVLGVTDVTYYRWRPDWHFVLSPLETITSADRKKSVVL